MGKKKKNDQPIASIIPVESVDASGEETYDGSNQEIKCPNCNYIIPIHNEVEINNKGAKCACIPCKFKVSKGDKTMNIDRRDNGDIKKILDK